MKKIIFLSLMILSCGFLTNAQTVAVKTLKTDEKNVKVNSEAYDLLRDARSTSRHFPANFAGFSADVIYYEDGKIYNGAIDYTPKVEMKFAMKGLADAESKKLESDITSLISHRRGGDFAKADGKYPITFGTDDKSPLGRMVCLNDELKSCYRVRDRQVVQVNRTMNDEFFTINILETMPTAEGKFLPRTFTVTYFDEKTKAMKRTQFFSDKYEQIEGVWLQKSRRIITCENSLTTVRIIEFNNFKLKTAV